MWNYNNKQIIIIGIIAFLIIIISFITVGFHGKSKVDAPNRNTIAEDADRSHSIPVSDATETEPDTIVVHVAGMVYSPGVYEFKPGERVNDALKKAGGALQNADLDNINLAAKLEDGIKIYIAQEGQIPKPAVSSVAGGSKPSEPIASKPAEKEYTSKSGTVPDKLRVPGEKKVNINTAPVEQLQRLPGVGPSTAQKILDYRNENGKFDSIEELDEVNGIGPSKLAKIRPFVTL